MERNVYYIENKPILQSSGNVIQTNKLIKVEPADIPRVKVEPLDNVINISSDDNVRILELCPQPGINGASHTFTVVNNKPKLLLPCVNGNISKEQYRTLVLTEADPPQNDKYNISVNNITTPGIHFANNYRNNMNNTSHNVYTNQKMSSATSLLQNSKPHILVQNNLPQASSPYTRKYLNNYSNDRYSLYSTGNSNLRNRPLYCAATLDNVIKIPPHLFKKQLTDSSDTVCPASLPKTRHQIDMEYNPQKNTTRPFRKMCSKLSNKFTRNCATNKEADSIDVEELGLFPIGYQVPIDKSKIKRITRRRKIKNITNTLKILEGNNIEYILPDESYNEIVNSSQQMMIDQDGNECYILSAQVETVGDDCEQILVINDDQEEVCQAKNNIEVLLAAAEEEEMSSNQVYFCQDENDLNNIQSSQIIITYTNQEEYTVESH